ncbi:ABC transporter ATP-binding protein [Pontixanthobacter aquaemixtae]|uniref:ATP-binding cassette domain-containing protein n=1 Tax=Pontixanthobacter aquaemixtae TaxID=1958940 RepID=A0A844ZTB8_9SPHN|nr:ABC transporter ATP-binding protein [Pontixanthobacter aquaemixtae]MXO90978.1 ATP-binding cassette domain-containing protein [Pontixanthobacter aquaemixtae]
MVIFRYLGIMWHASRQRSLLFFALLVLSSLTEGIGLVLLVPLLGTLQEVQSQPTGIVAYIIEGLTFVGVPITLTGLLGAFLALNLLRAVIVYFQTLVSERFRLEVLDGLRTRSFDAILESRWDWVVAQKRSDLSSLLITEVNRIGGALVQSVRLIISLISIGVYVVVAFTLSPVMAAIATVLGGLIFFLMRHQHQVAHRHGMLLSQANKNVQQTVEEGLSGLKLVKILRSENRSSAMMKAIRAKLRGRTLQFAKLNAAMGLIFQIAIALVLVAMLYTGIEVLELELPVLLILIVIFARLSPQIRLVQTQINGLQHTEAVMDNYHDLTREAGKVSEPVLQGNDCEPITLGKSIKLSNVSYSYKTRDARSLNDVSLEIPFRKTTAIMGTSGAGKSTLADILMGLLAPETGTVSVDGHALDAESRLNWRKSVAYMPQDVFLFHDTIRNNLLWADQSASEDDLEAALKKASAEFVYALPEGIETIVGDAGQRLSGGEKQRIALARALLQKPQLLILDEATSALDLANEARIREMIETLHAELTVVIIGHRLPALENADQLIVLESGTVKASGTWESVVQELPSD